MSYDALFKSSFLCDSKWISFTFIGELLIVTVQPMQYLEDQFQNNWNAMQLNHDLATLNFNESINLIE